MIDKKRGYYKDRPHYAVDANADITEGMIAFLTTNAAGTAVATTAASGDVPIGTFWNDHATGYVRTTVESGTFGATDIITLHKGNVRNTTEIKVTDSTGVTTYTQGVDYTVATANGVITRLGTGTIAASATVVIWYTYTMTVDQVHWENAGTKHSRGVNYDRQPDDTLGRGQITVVEGDSKIYTDMFDPTQTYALNSLLYPDANSLWSTAVSATLSACGRVIKVPTANDPFLGVDQIRVAA